jgi:hypothetical protein
MKYKIILSGRGSETYVHKITDLQFDRLSDLDLENPNVDFISEFLNVDDIFTTDDTFLGVYNDPECYMISVIDESENIIWESDVNHEFQDCDFTSVFDNQKSLLIEDYVKGQFFSYEIDVDQFDAEKLIPIVTEIGEVIEIITDLTYDGQSLNDTKDWLDFWSKGINYYLAG